MNGSFINSMLRSSTDFKFYKEIFTQPFGKTLRYLLFLSVLITMILGLWYSIGLNKFSQKTLKWVEENAPYIEINEGVVKADVEQPFIKEDKDFVMIIDTTGQIKEIGKEHKTGVLLIKDKLIIKQDDIRTQQFDLSKVKSFKLDKAAYLKIRKYFVFVFIPFMIVMQFIYFFAAKIVQVLITGLAVVIFKPGVKYSNILNLCIYALTPATLLALIVTLATPRPIPFFFVVYLGMYISFVVGAVRQCYAGNVNENSFSGNSGI